MIFSPRLRRVRDRERKSLLAQHQMVQSRAVCLLMLKSNNARTIVYSDSALAISTSSYTMSYCSFILNYIDSHSKPCIHVNRQRSNNLLNKISPHVGALKAFKRADQEWILSELTTLHRCMRRRACARCQVRGGADCKRSQSQGGRMLTQALTQCGSPHQRAATCLLGICACYSRTNCAAVP